MQYCSLQHSTLLLSPVTFTIVCCFALAPSLHFFWIYFPGGSDGKASVYNVRDLGLSPGLGRSPGEGNGNPLKYYCLENPMDREAWQSTVCGVAKSQTQLSNYTHQPGGVHLLVSYIFAFSTCSWGSQGKNTGVICHSLLQWNTFCQNSTMTRLSSVALHSMAQFH